MINRICNEKPQSEIYIKYVRITSNKNTEYMEPVSQTTKYC